MSKVSPNEQKTSRLKSALKVRTEHTSQTSIRDVADSQRVDSVGAVPYPKDQMTKEGEWIRKHVRKKVCRRFVPAETAIKDPGVNSPLPPIKTPNQKPMRAERDPTCKCGYKKSKHIREAMADPDRNPPWRPQVDTKSSPTDAFGEIEFMGFGQKIGKYVRVAQDTSTDTMLKLLIEKWGLEKPNLVISVTGGAKSFQMVPRLKDVFKQGLMKVAKSTGAWIITGGMHAGVMKYVGQAVKEFELSQTSKAKVTAIGIATWGCVRNRELLIDRHGKWPAEYRMEPYDNKIKEPGSALDNNHSHFILVDNGSQHQFGVEIDFRGRLEGSVAKMKTNTGHDAISIPIVCVVLEGGPGTLETVKSAVENGTPAVIVRGSGRAADILGYAFANSRAEEIEVTDQFGKTQKRATTVMDDTLIHQIMQMIKDELGVPDVVKCLDWVKQSLQKRDLITVFQLDSPESAKDLDLAILYAMLKANKDQVMDQLRLAIAWNRIDVCKEMLFTDDRRWEQKDLHDVMYTVLILDRFEFAHLFIENGVNLKDFLTLRRLLMLYNEIPKNSLLYQLLLKTAKDKSKKFDFKTIGNLIAELMGDFYNPLYLRLKKYKCVDADQVLSNKVEKTASVASFVGMIRDDAEIDPDTGLVVIPTDFDDPSRELFIWSILMLRQDLSQVFWGEGKDAIPAALTACNLLKGLHLKTQDTEIQKQIDKMIEHYEALALGVLNECYQADDQKAQLLLVRELPNYGLATSLLLAVHADNKIFISHSCCQSLLNSIWRGKMTQDNGAFRIFVCIFMPFLVPALIYYREDEHKSQEVIDAEMEEEAKTTKRRQTRPSLHHSATESFEMNDQDGTLVLQETGTDTHQDSGINLRDSGKKLTCWERVVVFFSAPMITFIYNCVFYIAFLLLYSVILLVTFNPTVTAEEIVLMVWVFTLFAEEVRQVAQDDSSSFRLKLWNYITDNWNVLDVITLILFLTGMILRAIPDNTNTFRAARIVLSINLLTFYLRLLHIFSVFKQLGPVLVMIARMMVDLLWFMIILMVFMVGFGVAQHAILYPNASADGILILNVIRKAYWQMQGEIETFLNELEVSCVNSPETQAGCSVEGIITPIMMGCYILFTNVLMFNLLIAMFSYTFSKIQENTDLHWYFQRYFLIYEYYERPDVAPPLIIFNHMYLLIKWFVSKCCARCCAVTGRQRGFKMRFADNEEKQLILWENMNADEYLRRMQIVEKESIEHRVRETRDRIEQLYQRFDELQTDNKQAAVEAGSTNAIAVAGTQERVPVAVEKKLQFLEDHMTRTSKALDWIITAMSENNMGARAGPPKLQDMEKEKQLARQQSYLQKLLKKQKAEQKAKEVKKVVENNIDLQVQLNVRSRTSPYPQSVPPVRRFELPDNKISWTESFPEYAPMNFTHPDVLRSKPKWADVDLLAFQNAESRPELQFNEYDLTCSISRISFEGPYDVEEGIPKNPIGRTGLTGRGLLGRWGPNFAADPIITRWKTDSMGKPVFMEGKQVLEFVAVERTDIKQWALPGCITNKTREDQVYDCIKADFTQEAINTLGQDRKQQASVRLKLDNLFKNGGTVVYKGYTDDPRNTDNAWLETIAVNYHDEDGKILNPFKLRAGDAVGAVGWQIVSSTESLYGGHLALLKKVAELRDAYF